MTKAGLLARAAELDVPGRSKMSKPELIEAITEASAPKRGAEDFLTRGRRPARRAADCRPPVIDQEGERNPHARASPIIEACCQSAPNAHGP